MELTKSNKLTIVLLLGTVLYAFIFGASGDICKVWEDAAVVATIFYGFTIYILGFYWKEFRDLKLPEIGTIVGFLLVILALTTPFIKSLLGNHFSIVENLEIDILNPHRTLKLLYLFIIAFLFSSIDWIMIKQNFDTINYDINFRYSDVPVTIIFFILMLYSFYSYQIMNIANNYLDHFFEGAIAFQMMLSNIIWMYNDEEFWEELRTNNSNS